MSKKVYIAANNLSCYRNHIKVFDNISLSVVSKSFTVIKGKNGSGKTSLLLGLARILKVEGRIIWSKEANLIGYVGHKNALKENEKVREYINFWKTLYNSNLSVEEVIESYSLENILDHHTYLLSYGQKKLLSFVRLNLVNSLVWLLDEPLSGLDINKKKLILKKIENHSKKGGAIIMTTHDEFYLKSKTPFIEKKID